MARKFIDTKRAQERADAVIEAGKSDPFISTFRKLFRRHEPYTDHDSKSSVQWWAWWYKKQDKDPKSPFYKRK